MASVVSYSPPWWVNLLHRLPHFNLRFEQTSSDFQPEDWTYQQVKYLLVFSSFIVNWDCLIINKWSVMKDQCPGHPQTAHMRNLSPVSPGTSCHHLIRVTICGWSTFPELLQTLTGFCCKMDLLIYLLIKMMSTFRWKSYHAHISLSWCWRLVFISRFMWFN